MGCYGLQPRPVGSRWATSVVRGRPAFLAQASAARSTPTPHRSHRGRVNSVQAIVISVQPCSRTETQPAEFTPRVSDQPLRPSCSPATAPGQRCSGPVGRTSCRRGTPRRACRFSPVTDLTFSGDSFRTNAKCDLVLPMARKAEMLRYYLGSEDPSAPCAPPLFADFPAPPPVFLQISSTEALYDDSRRMAESLERAGGTVVCDVWKGMPHVWTLMEGHMPEAREGLRRAGAFICRCVDQADATGLTMR